uniref:Ig-like domain-containing protein n=1 Tax=Hucho hucho TaxID=62062 RepID=A0A4W5KDH0_9TELE
MTSATSFLFFAIHFACIRAGNSSETFVKLECKEEYHGVHGQQSLLQCNVKAVQNVTILTVTWKNMKADTLLLEYHKDKSNLTPGFKFAEPSWNKNNMNVSLLLTNTKMADKGLYECMVRTDCGDAIATTSLRVTAMYKSPTISSSPENCIKQNTDVTIFCNSTGGLTSLAQTAQGVLNFWPKRQTTNLSSKLTVLKATYSGSTNYSCTVHNTNGV